MTNPEITNLKLFVYVGQILNDTALVHQYASVDLDFDFDTALTRKNVQNEITYIGLTAPIKSGLDVGKAVVVRLTLDAQSNEPVEVEYVMDYHLNPSPILQAWLALWKQGQLGIKTERLVRWIPTLEPLLAHIKEQRIERVLREIPKDARLYVLSNIYRDAIEAD